MPASSSSADGADGAGAPANGRDGVGLDWDVVSQVDMHLASNPGRANARPIGSGAGDGGPGCSRCRPRSATRPPGRHDAELSPVPYRITCGGPNWTSVSTSGTVEPARRGARH